MKAILIVGDYIMLLTHHLANLFLCDYKEIFTTNDYETLNNIIRTGVNKIVIISNEETYNKVIVLYKAKEFDLLRELYYTLKEEEDKELYDELITLINNKHAK